MYAAKMYLVDLVCRGHLGGNMLCNLCWLVVFFNLFGT